MEPRTFGGLVSVVQLVYIVKALWFPLLVADDVSVEISMT